ncbi:MAG: hypothetical protein R3C01_05940 [Planctomycetaceae bacterium]
MTTNPELEMRWIKAWSELHDIIGERRSVACLLPNWTVVEVEECKAWLQDSVYAGYLVEVKADWVGHVKGVVVSRSLAAKSM